MNKSGVRVRTLDQALQTPSQRVTITKCNHVTTRPSGGADA